MYEWYHHVPSYFLLTSILYIVVYFLKELNICESILRIREYANIIATSGIPQGILASPARNNNQEYILEPQVKYKVTV